MKKIVFFIGALNLCCNSSAQNISEIQKKISSKIYSLKFSINRTILNTPSSENIDGLIFRNNGYIYSETRLGKGIFEDTLGLHIDEPSKDVNLFNNFSKSTILINPFYDPAEIMNFALTYSNSKKTSTKDGELTSDFSFLSDSVPAKKMRVIENNKNNTFIIEFTYQRLNEIVKDIINYKILPDTIKLNAPKISDYIEVKDGRYVKKPILSEYSFFNSTALESLFKKKS